MCIFRILCLVASSLLVSVHAGESEALYAQAKDALRKSQDTPGGIVTAARLFMKASASFEADGNQEATQEAQSFLYWCKKKMTLKDAEALHKGGETEVIQALSAVEQKTVDPNDAETWFKRAEEFAAKNPGDDLLIAVRYFEVADRFKGTDISLKAQDLSLKAQQTALANISRRPAVQLSKPVVPAGRQPLPEAAKVSAVQKTIRDVFKADYASNATPDMRIALSRKLLQQAGSEADTPTRYTLLREALDLAVKNNDAAMAIQAAEALENSFEVDGVEEASQAFNRMAVATLNASQATEFCERAMALGTKAQARDQFEKLSSLSTLVTRAAPRTLNKDLMERVKTWSQAATDASREFTVLKKHIATLEKNPDDEEANLAFGRFYVFHYGDLPRGLPALARGSDAALKAIAEQELANPVEPLPQIGLGSAWRDWGTSKPDAQKFPAFDRAVFWYRKALPNAAGLERVKLEKDLRELALSRPLHGLPPAVLKVLGLGDPIALKPLPVIGNTGRSGKFEHKPASGMLLIGIEFTTGPDFAATVVKSAQPIYLSQEGIVQGKLFGQSHSNPTKVLAKPGYAVGGIVCRSGSRMDRVRLTFMRVTAKGLDARDSYESDWIGGQGGSRDVKTATDGRFVFGLHGHAGDNLDAIGLLLKE